MKKLTLIIVTLLVAMVFKANAAVNVGDTISTDIKLVQIQADGSKINESLYARPQGQFLILDFFATTCRYCIDNLPVLNQLARDNASKLTAKLVDIDRSTAVVEEFVKQNRNLIFFPVALDNNREAAKFFGIRGTPTFYLINAEGKVVYWHEGGLEPVHVQEINSLINGSVN